MTDEVKDAPKVEESKEETTAKVEAEETEVKAEAETKAEDTKLGELLDTKSEPKEPKMVPEAVLLEYKKDNKELKKDLKELRKLIEDGASKQEVSQELKDIAEEHNVDPEFLNKLAKSIKAQSKAELEAEFSSKMKPIEEKERQKKTDEIFNEHYEKALIAMPEYKGIASKEVIKALALNPANANKSFAKILEESYGHLIQGKKTIEPTKPRGGVGDVEIDFNKAGTDKEYFREIMADPELKAKYNKDLHKRIKL